MKKLSAGLAFAAALGVAASVPAAPADAGVFVRIGPGYHHYHGGYYRPYYHPYYHHYYARPVVVFGGPYYWHGRHWHNRYWCSRHWCYR